MSSGVWLYAVGRGFVEGLTGVAGEQVRGIERDGLIAAGGTVGLDQFGAEPLRRHFEDLDWLAATAQAHEAVVAALAQTSPAVPLRLATVYLDDERVRQMLAWRRTDFENALQRVEGRDEWGVKAFEVAQPETATQPVTSGAAYL